MGGGLIRSKRVALMQSHQPVSGCYGTVARARGSFRTVFGPTVCDDLRNFVSREMTQEYFSHLTLIR